MWLFYYFKIELSYGVLKSKSPCILLNKNTKFDKNETESKMENPTHSFRQTNLVLQLIEESRIKSKTLMSWNRERKNKAFFVPFILSKRNFLISVFFLDVYCIEHTFRIYIYIYIYTVTY